MDEIDANDDSVLFPSTNRQRVSASTSWTRHPSSRKDRRLSEKEKRLISSEMHLSYYRGKLKHGTIQELAQQHGVSRWTIQRLWKEVHQAIVDKRDPVLKPKFKGRIPHLTLDMEKVRNAKLDLRKNLNGVAKLLGCSYSTAQRLVCKRKIRTHTNSIKPFLTEENKIKRLQFVLAKIVSTSIPRNPVFECMYNYVHIDEKWFYMTTISQRYYLMPDEPDPHRTCKNKKYIQKIMFMAATARPRYALDGTCTFNGKIGIFPFTVLVPAARASKNRARGTVETKPIESITKEVIKHCLIEKVIPAIKERWTEGNKDIIIQQDNARPHIKGDDPDFVSVAQSDGFNIVLECQPPNSPDLNINDLGFFRVIQTIQHEKSPKTVCELVTAVLEAFEETSHVTLNYVWLSLMHCMSEILKDKGDNKYKLPHMNKKKLQRLGILPTHISPNKEAMLARMTELGIEIPIDDWAGNQVDNAIGSHMDLFVQNEGQQDATNQWDIQYQWDESDQLDAINQWNDAELFDAEDTGDATIMGYETE